MLNWMRVKNLALVSEADMEFGPGFNVVTGETGAGKSVIMGGVALLLGARAEKSAIRIGEDRCEVSGEFTLSEESRKRLAEVFADAGIEVPEEGTLLVRRVITASSGRNLVNESSVTLQTLKKIGNVLVDTHSAHESRHLFDTDVQRNMIDRFGHHEQLLDSVRTAYRELLEIRAKIRDFASTIPSAEETVRLKRDAAEISHANVSAGEDDELEARHALAANSRSIIELALAAANALSECDDSLADRIGQIRRTLADLEKFDPQNGGRFLNAVEALSEAVNELSSDLSTHASNVDMDESEFQAMEERMRVLQTMKRRYGPTLEDVLSHYDEISRKIDAYENSELRRKEFEELEKNCETELIACCALLTEARKKAASGIAKQVTDELRQLGFKHAVFDVSLAASEPSAEGADAVEFMFSANPGVPLLPLREVASSGETSRVMLAVKTVLADADAVPILIFDEIDANIGGETAICVGREIGELAKKKQILCISHLPQVACFAKTHFKVEKSSEEEHTESHVTHLSAAERIPEIARMLGGGKQAEVHAKAMLQEKR